VDNLFPNLNVGNVGNFKVNCEKISVFEKIHESSKIICKYKMSDNIEIDYSIEYGKFLRIRLNLKLNGYVLMSSDLVNF